VLLRRWLARRPGEAVGEALAPEQRGALAGELARERACLLACLEAIMLHHYATADGEDGSARARSARSRPRMLLGERCFWPAPTRCWDSITLAAPAGPPHGASDNSLCLQNLPARASLVVHQSAHVAGRAVMANMQCTTRASQKQMA